MTIRITIFLNALTLCLAAAARAEAQRATMPGSLPTLSVSISRAAAPIGRAATMQIRLDEIGLEFPDVDSLAAYVRASQDRLAETAITFRAAPDLPLHDIAQIILAFSTPQIRGPHKVTELRVAKPSLIVPPSLPALPHPTEQTTAPSLPVLPVVPSVPQAPASPPPTEPVEPPGLTEPPIPATSPATRLEPLTATAEPWSGGTPVNRLEVELASMVAGKSKVAYVLDVNGDYFEQASRLVNRAVTAVPTDRDFAVYALDAGRNAVRVVEWGKADAIGRQLAARATRRHVAAQGATNLAALSARIAMDATADCVVVVTEGMRLQASESLSLAFRTLADGRQVSVLFVGAPLADVRQAVEEAIHSGGGQSRMVTPRQLESFANLP